jgi:hypothetical protein
LGSFLKSTKVAKNCGLLFIHVEGYVLILAKKGWATFWAILYQTRLIALFPSDRKAEGVGARNQVNPSFFQINCFAEAAAAKSTFNYFGRVPISKANSKNLNFATVFLVK